MPDDLQTEIERRIGKPPEHPGFWGSYTDPKGVNDYAVKKKYYEQAAAHLAPQLAEADLNPMTAGQFHQITGTPKGYGSSADQYKDVTSLEPSSVPSFQSPQMKGFETSTSPLDTPQPHMAMGQDGSLHQSMLPGDQARNEGLTPQHSTTPLEPNAPQVRPQVPQGGFQAERLGGASQIDPLASRGQEGPFQAQPGKPQDITRKEYNLDAPTNWPQREVYESTIKRMGSPWYGQNRGMGGANTLNAKQQMIEKSLIDQGMAPEEAHSHAGLLATGASEAQSRNESRSGNLKVAQDKLKLQQGKREIDTAQNELKDTLIKARTALIQQQTSLAPKDFAYRHARLKLAEEQFQFGKDAFMTMDKAGEYDDETHALAAEHIARAAGMVGDVKHQSYWSSLADMIRSGRKSQEHQPPQYAPQGQQTAPQSTPAPSGATDAPRAAKVEPAKAQEFPPVDADELRQAMEKATPQHEGRTYTTQSGNVYTFQRGIFVPTKKGAE